jgi:hypothetical protein
MRPHRYEQLPDIDLQPMDPVRGIPLDRQAASMRQLRAAHNRIADSFRERDLLMQAWALSHSLSRHDMAVATGLVKSRVDQIIRDLTLADTALKQKEAEETGRRATPNAR